MVALYAVRAVTLPTATDMWAVPLSEANGVDRSPAPLAPVDRHVGLATTEAFAR